MFLIEHVNELIHSDEITPFSRWFQSVLAHLHTIFTLSISGTGRITLHSRWSLPFLMQYYYLILYHLSLFLVQMYSHLSVQGETSIIDKLLVAVSPPDRLVNLVKTKKTKLKLFDLYNTSITTNTNTRQLSQN